MRCRAANMTEADFLELPLVRTIDLSSGMLCFAPLSLDPADQIRAHVDDRDVGPGCVITFVQLLGSNEER